MIIVLNSPGVFLKCACFILKKSKVDVFILGKPKAPQPLHFKSVTYTKKDKIGFVNYPDNKAIEAFLGDASIKLAISHFAHFFAPVNGVEEKLEHILKSKINFFKAAQLNFFLENELERSDERVFVLDSSLLSFLTVPFGFNNKKIFHIYLPFSDICKASLMSLRHAYKVFQSCTSLTFFNFRKETERKEEEKKIGIFFHQGQKYGNLYKKNHYYATSPKSKLHESRVRKLSYNYGLDPEVALVKPSIGFNDIINVFNSIPFKLILTSPHTISLKHVLNISFIFMKFLGWKNIIPSLHVNGVIYDYDILFPKELSLALASLKIKTCCLQERPVAAFYNYNFGVIVDTYIFAGALFCRHSENKPGSIFFEKKISYVPWRLNFFDQVKDDSFSLISSHDNIEIGPDTKLIVFVGYYLDISDEYPLTCRRANEEFLKYVVACAKQCPDHKIVICLKDIDLFSSEWFAERISGFSNINVSGNSVPSSSYMYCKHAEFVVSVQSSLVEECVGFGKKVVLIDDLFCVNNVCSGVYPKDFKFMIVNSISAFEDRIKRLINNNVFLDREYALLKEKIIGHYRISHLKPVSAVLEKGLV